MLSSFRRRWTSPALLLMVALALALLAGCGSTGVDNAEETGSTGSQEPGREAFTLDIRGSDTMVNVGAALAEAYMSENSHAELVVQGGGSGTGIAALLNQNAHIAQSSRAIRPSEMEEGRNKGLEIKEIIIGRDAVVVCVHPDNPLEEISLEDLGRIYRGEVGNWSQLGGQDAQIVVLSRDTSSGTHVFFKEAVVELDGAHSGAEYGDDTMMVPSTSFIADEVARNPNAIGYIGLGYLDERTKALGLVGPEGSVVFPDKPHPDGLSYPLARPLYFYLAGEPEGGLADYIEFVLGPAGQQVVRDLQFLPIK